MRNNEGGGPGDLEVREVGAEVDWLEPFPCDVLFS